MRTGTTEKCDDCVDAVGVARLFISVHFPTANACAGGDKASERDQQSSYDLSSFFFFFFLPFLSLSLFFFLPGKEGMRLYVRAYHQTSGLDRWRGEKMRSERLDGAGEDEGGV